MSRDPYYRRDLAEVHDAGYAFHADRCAPGVLALLEPVLARHGTVVELGAGSGHMTRHLLGAGHDVIATDASLPMLDVMRERDLAAGTTGRLRIERLTMPTDPIPPCDAVVSIGHPLSYLDTDDEIEQVLVASARALAPGGVLAVDLCAPDYHEAENADVPAVRRGEDWILVQTKTRPDPGRFVRHITTFRREPGGLWRRDDEEHANRLTDPTPLVAALADNGVDVRVRRGFGDEVLPPGLVTITGVRATDR